MLVEKNHQAWDKLHQDVRHKLEYPSEHVIRFMAGFPREFEKRNKLKVLDIGCGGGRHVKVFAEQGFQTSGVDFSVEGIEYADQWLKSFNLQSELLRADMTSLPFEDDSFDGALSFGVFYYGNREMMERAVSEVYRVMKQGARALILTKSNEDFRFGKGDEIEKNTFYITGNETGEQDMTLCFLDEKDVRAVYSLFSRIRVERNDYHFADLSKKHSDWLITLEK